MPFRGPKSEMVTARCLCSARLASMFTPTYRLQLSLPLVYVLIATDMIVMSEEKKTKE